MCYEFSNWFQKARAKEFHRARQSMDRVKEQKPAQSPAQEPAARPAEAATREKVPA